MFSLETLIFIGTLVAVTYWYVNRKYTYWKRKGIQYDEPTFPYGNTKGVFKTIHLTDIISDLYKKMKGHGSFCGAYFYFTPTALILDPKLIKNILIKDFQYFMDRGLYYNEKHDPLSAHLFALDAPEWKELRSKLTSTFTSGKMKYMYPTVTKVSEELKEALEKSLNASDELEIKDYLARFTTDVIGTCAFGIDCNSLRDPDAIFREMGKKIFAPRRSRVFISLIANISTKFARFIGLSTNPDDVIQFFMKVVKDTVTFREKNQVKRNDFMDLMIQLKNHSSNIERLSMNQVSAQAFVFFLAGFETSSTLMTYALYELALNKDIQIKARQEIDEVLKKYNGDFSYDAMMDMKYIDQILNESLRKYPPLAFLVRRAIKDYPVPDTNYTLPAEQRIWLPIHAIQNDPDYYPEPEKFNPDRFTAEAVQARDPMTFLPFGDGPRNCIGMRFGQMQARVGLVTILRNFDVSLSSRTPVPLVIDPKTFILSPLGGVWLKMKRI